MADPEETKTTTSALGTLSAAVSLTGAIAGAVGISTGVLTSLLRSYPWLTGIAFLIGAIGAWVALISTVTKPKEDGVRSLLPTRPPTNTARAIWAGLGSFIFVLAILSLGGLYATSLRTTQRPLVIASYSGAATDKGPATLKVQVKAAGLNLGERFLIQVDALDVNRSSLEKVFFTWTGPSSEGLVDYQVDVPIGTLKPGTTWIGASARLEKDGQADTASTSACGFPVSTPLLPPGPVVEAAATSAAAPASPNPIPQGPVTLTEGTTCTIIRVPNLPSPAAMTPTATPPK